MRWRTIIIIFPLLFCGFDSRSVPKRFEFTETHMGTRFRIVVYAVTPHAATLASSAAFETIARLDAIMSDYNETSELMSLCRQPAGSKVRVSDDLFSILQISQTLAEKSRGAFDITVGPLIRLWRRARRSGELPERSNLEQARTLSGYKGLHLDPANRTVTLERDGMLLDLGGIAKGYAADAAIRVLKRHGIKQALVAAGGDIAVSSPPPGSPGWVIGVASPESVDAEPSLYLLLHDSAVSTSGDARQYIEIGGVRYSHIVDPRTGFAVTGRTGVTVVAKDCTTTDSLATAASVLGADDGRALVDSIPGAAALFSDATGKRVIRTETLHWKDIPKTRARHKTD